MAILTKDGKILETLDGDIGNFGFVSVINAGAYGGQYVNIVIGAPAKERCASSFSKTHLQTLINELQQVCDLMTPTG